MNIDKLNRIAAQSLRISYARGYCTQCNGSRVEMNSPLNHQPECELGEFEREQKEAEKK